MRRLSLAVSVLALTCAPAARAAEKPPFLQLVRGGSYEIRDDAETTTVSVPVSLKAAATIDGLEATVVSVSLGEREDLALADAFTVTPERAAAGRGPRLRVDIDTEPGLEPGTYDLIVDVRRTGRLERTQRRRQRVALALNHVAATLRAPPTIVVERTGGFLFIDEKTESRPLRLAETSGRTRLSGITITQIDGPTGTRVTNGELLFDVVPGIPPGGHRTAHPEARGSFPLGSSTGTLQIDAPQLAGGVTSAFEVRSSSHWLGLVLAILAGVLVGWLVRQVLAGVIARNEAREPGYALLEAIAIEHERRRDAGFRTTIAGIRSRLEDSLRSERGPAAIESSVAAARAELQAASADLDKQRDDTLAALMEVAANVRTPWVVPDAVRDALAAHVEALDEAERLIGDYDVGRADDIVRQARRAVLAALRDVVPARATGIRTFLAVLDEAGLPLPTRTEVAAYRSEIEAALASTRIDDTALDAQTVLKGLHAAETRLRRLLGETLPRMTVPVSEAVEALEGLGDRAATEAVLAAERRLREALSHRQVELHRISELAAELMQRLRAAILSLVPEDGTTARARIVARMDGGRYVDAARRTVEAMPKPSRDRLLGPVAGPAPAELEGYAIIPTVTAPALPAVIMRAGPAVRDSAFDLARARGASRATLSTAIRLRTLLVGFGVVLVGCGLFLPSYTGTFAQLLAAFLWGFAADVTSEGLYQLARSSTTPAAASAPTATTRA